MPPAKQRPPTAIDGEAALCDAMRRSLDAKLRHAEKDGQQGAASRERKAARQGSRAKQQLKSGSGAKRQRGRAARSFKS